MVRIDIVDPEDYPAPPSRDLAGMDLQVHNCVAEPKAHEHIVRSTGDDFESETLVELHRPGHVPDGERYGADVRDGHCLGVPVPFCLRTACNEPHADPLATPHVVIS